MGKRNTRTKEQHAQIPRSVMESAAWHWLPYFARVVAVSMAVRFNGYNNGGLELTQKDAEGYGVSRGALWAGIGLAIHAGLIKRTVKAKKRSGKGIPAKYALTWRPLAEFPSLNIVGTDVPANTWKNFEPPDKKITSINAAEIFLGYRNPRKVQADGSDRNNKSSSKPSGGPFQNTRADRSARKPDLRADRSDSEDTFSGGPLRPPSKNLGRGTRVDGSADKFMADSNQVTSGG